MLKNKWRQMKILWNYHHKNDKKYFNVDLLYKFNCAKNDVFFFIEQNIYRYCYQKNYWHNDNEINQKKNAFYNKIWRWKKWFDCNFEMYVMIENISILICIVEKILITIVITNSIIIFSKHKIKHWINNNEILTSKSFFSTFDVFFIDE